MLQQNEKFRDGDRSLQKAVIIGGGISGKLAARVLSDYFQEVIILERDQEPIGPYPRKGTPQGEHLHALLFAGSDGLEALFPGITEQFHSSGAIKINSTQDLAWFHHGVWKLRFDGGDSSTLQTRPHLEWHIEQYLKRIRNVTIQYNHHVQNYVFDKEKNRVIGVKAKDKSGSIKTLHADLIVDGSGVSSLTSNWLNQQGIHIPEEKVKIGLSYISKFFQLPENHERDWAIKLVYPNPPHEKIGGTLSKVEGNRYIVTIIGYHNEIHEKEVLKTENGFIELTKRLPKPDIYQEIKDATALSDTSVYHVPHIIWRRFDKIKNLPEGLLLIGDTICRIDPVFGQGMSIAVLEAQELKKLLHQNQTQQKITATFHKHAAKIISPIWNMVLTEDFRYPETIGKKPDALSFQQWYAKNIFLLSSENQEVFHSFIKVMNLIKPTTILMRPKIIKSVLKRAFSR
ncbi:FAD-dependent oxidoreductase [Neobacillus massiliamazoniensis]|uniref:Putative NADPH-dependent glutamate synthase beta chain n=1 Tax=Neobacillus massiliamazoniensis TaxID=1499688 RepID=A0A0U1NYD9_9BACI|nr:FAD-dependent monooxygenase [Neobacillus massiliamazoniensis]CRK83050.1 putative NADPH-dependent glutamate synthase beta chain [Neobacillus massiliamazoniensis]